MTLTRKQVGSGLTLQGEHKIIKSVEILPTDLYALSGLIILYRSLNDLYCFLDIMNPAISARELVRYQSLTARLSGTFISLVCRGEEVIVANDETYSLYPTAADIGIP